MENNKTGSEPKKSSWGIITKYPNVVPILVLYAIYYFSSFFYLSYYGVEAVNNLYSNFFALLFLVGLFIGALRKPLLISSLIFFFISVFVAFSIAPILLMAHTIASVIKVFILPYFVGIGMGLLLRRFLPLNKNLFIKFGLAGGALLFVFLMVKGGGKIEDCQSISIANNTYERDFCYSRNALRRKDEQICASILDDEDRRTCYDDVIFEREKKGQKSIDKCNVISNEDDREYCHFKVAIDHMNQKICETIKNKKLFKECIWAIESIKCEEIPKEQKEEYLGCRGALEKKKAEDQNKELLGGDEKNLEVVVLKTIDFDNEATFIGDEKSAGLASWDQGDGKLILQTKQVEKGKKNNVRVFADVDVSKETMAMKFRMFFPEEENQTDSTLGVYINGKLVKYIYSNINIERGTWNDSSWFTEIASFAGKKVQIWFDLMSQDSSMSSSVYLDNIVFVKTKEADEE